MSKIWIYQGPKLTEPTGTQCVPVLHMITCSRTGRARGRNSLSSPRCAHLTHFAALTMLLLPPLLTGHVASCCQQQLHSQARWEASHGVASCRQLAQDSWASCSQQLWHQVCGHVARHSVVLLLLRGKLSAREEQALRRS